ncbi:MAG: chromosomal replication initiator protein DnaA [Patescibacteria group bacterium]
MDLQKLWKTAVSEIEIELGKAQTKIYFNNTSLASLENNVATVNTPNSASKNALDKKYYTLVQNALERQTKTKLSILFEIKIVEKKSEESLPLFAESKPTIIQNDPSYSRTHLNPKYKFSTLVVGSSNNFAHAAAIRICKNPGREYNPFFIYGGVGIGKTHLMQAVGNELFEKLPNLRIMYTTAELFLNDLVASFQDKNTPAFKRKYRDIDLLLMDDIQFMSGKQSAQEEFFHCFNTLFMSEKQVILTSDRPPQEIKVEDRLLSRLMGGLSVDIQSPDLEMRMAIINQKLEIRNEKWDQEIVGYLAGRFQNNIREIEGTIQRLIVQGQASNTPVTLEFIKDNLPSANGAMEQSKENFASPKTIIAAVSKITGIRSGEILSDRRQAELVWPRQIVMYILRNECKMGLIDIASALNRKDHTTVMHAVTKMEDLYPQNEKLREQIMLIKKEVWG